jgi:hypothetical protein
MENIRNDHILSCPYCNKRYFPGEIFIPKNFLGTACFISEELYIGNDMELTETYTCDACNNIFKVSAEVSFTCSRTKIGNFDENF